MIPEPSAKKLPGRLILCEQLTFEKLEDRKAALGKRRLSRLREECLSSARGHDWASLANFAPSVLQYCRHCLSAK
jgi:hypothetical protein